MKKGIKIFLIIILIFILIWFFIRLISSREIDDVTPGISCEDEKKYLEKSEYLWVIPNFQGNKISENTEWCEEILGYKPKDFKYPQLRYNKENKKLLKENGLKIRTKFSQFTHKVYHCDNGGISPDDYKITDIFRGIIDNRVADVL